VGVGSGVTLDMTFQVNRNSSGIITTTVQKSAALLAAGIDSIITRYIYNTSSSRYTSASFDITIGGFTVTDSAVYTYDGSGRIISDLHYLVTGLVPPFEAIKNQYTYSANGQNLVSIDVLGAANPGDPLTLISSQAFTFDAKSDALILKNEAIILGRHGFYNANNATKVDFTSPVDPSQNFTLDYTYKYNSTNRPDSSYATRTPGGAVTASKYFYQ
jgi:hypothetical protein